MKNIYSILALFLFAFLFYASSTVQPLSKTELTYSEVGTRKTTETVGMTYTEPEITPDNDTKQTQTKGGVTISCDVVPFVLNKSETVTETPFFRDPFKQDYDVFQTAHKPVYAVTPDEVQLTITIKNNQSHVLKMRECAIAMIVDNIQFSIPQESTAQWENTNVMSNFSTVYTFRGPKINTLRNAKSLEIFINDIPVSFDQAGNIEKRENFDWIFICRATPKTGDDHTTYTYEEVPVPTKQCDACSGRGYFEEVQVCSTCKGSGQVKSYLDGKIYTCGKCAGTGKVVAKIKCLSCAGTGILKFPKSPLPPVSSRVTWNGWRVSVNSTPSGAQVRVVNTKTGQYQSVGTTPISVEYFATSSNSCPIIIEYDSQEVKVLPTNATGNKQGSIRVDFKTGTPIVKTGTLSN